MAETNFLKSHPAHVARLRAVLPEGAALEEAVGGDFVTVGKLEHARPGDHLNQFMDRHAIGAWAGHLDFHVDFITDGDKPHIPLNEDLTWHDGRLVQGQGCLGQLVAVLSNSLTNRPPMTGSIAAHERLHFH
jgi:hypothetical protein